MPATPARGDAVALTRTLVAIDSRNPSLVGEGPGERACAHALAGVLDQWGFRVEIQETAGARPNVIARIGQGGGRTLLFNGHLDTVGTEGMAHPPWDAAVRNGRVYGRGATDMKGGVAAMCAAALRAVDAGLPGEVIVAAVADEEYESIGTRAFVASGVRADAAIVTEPTRLAICPAHRGFAWLELVVHGRAAHGSRYDIGVDAITLAAAVLTELDAYQRDVLTARSHPLLGRPSLHASTIGGGLGLSTYPDRCSVQLERRTLPGETAADFTREVEDACNRVRARISAFRADIVPGFAQLPNDVAATHPVVRALATSLERWGEPATVEGLPCWTDAALLSAAGIPAICFGPGDIGLAHSAEEYVEIGEIERATVVLSEFVSEWFSETP
ncbi:MAG: ArgE/DapE family deacylase [Gemmatimonadaceae bacterium]